MSMGAVFLNVSAIGSANAPRELAAATSARWAGDRYIAAPPSAAAGIAGLIRYDPSTPPFISSRSAVPLLGTLLPNTDFPASPKSWPSAAPRANAPLSLDL